MSSIELTPRQKALLSALIDRHQRTEGPVTASEIAREIERNPGTIRNQMQSLKALQLVEGLVGPKGGYEPTTNAYEALSLQQLDQPAEIPVIREGEPVGGTIVEEIELTNVQHPERCRAELTLHGSLTTVHEGDTIRIGPTPLSKLVIEGTLEGTDETGTLLRIDITAMEAPAKEHPLPA